MGKLLRNGCRIVPFKEDPPDSLMKAPGLEYSHPTVGSLPLVLGVGTHAQISADVLNGRTAVVCAGFLLHHINESDQLLGAAASSCRGSDH